MMKQKIDFIRFIKIWGVLFLVGLAVVLIGYEVFDNYQNFNKRTDKIRKDYIAQQKEVIKESVKNIVNLINYDCTKNKNSEEEISKELLAVFSEVRHGKDGYAFILKLLNIQGGKDFATMYLNPNRKDLIGKHLSDDLKDAKGKMFRKEFLEGLRKNGECYVDYWYKKFENKEPSPKTSFFKLTNDKKFIVAVGVYLDDIDKDIALLQGELENNLRTKLAYSVLIVAIIVLCFLFLFNLFFNKLKNDYNQFKLFFQRVAFDDNPIDLEGIKFLQLAEMAMSANNMLENRIKVRKELEESEEKFRNLVENLGEGIGVVDAEECFTFANSEAERIFGVQPGELIGKSLLDFFDDETGEFFKNQTKLRQKGEPGRYDISFTNKDKKHFHLTVTTTPQLDENGKFIGTLGVFGDFTKQQLAIEALRESEERYSNIVEGLLIGLAIHANDKIIFLNKALRNLLGITSEREYLNKNIIEFIHPEDTDKVLREVESVLTSLSTPKLLEHRLIKIDGSELVVETLPSVISYYGKTAMMVMIRDITKRDQAVKALNRSEEFNKSITQSAADSIIAIDKDGIIILWNNAAEKIFGYSSDEMINKDLSAVLPSAYQDKHRNGLARLKEGREEKVIGKVLELSALRRDGSEFPIELSLSSWESEDEKYFTGIIRDITERKKTEKEIIQSKEKAENADMMKSIFLAQMSHEIRTPINALVSMSSLLRYDFEESADEDQMMSFDIIDRAGERIIRTVDLLLNLSEIQAGTYEPLPTRFDIIEDVISVIMAEHKKIAKKKRIGFSLDSSILDAELVADSYTVNQIFMQLVDNAIKYTEQGEVIIKVLRNELDQLVVEIKDTGIGIEESYLPHLFEPFSQEEMGYTRKFEGNGIGMALVQKYCQLNNAKIEVDSEKGVGSAFRVIFN